MPLCARIIEIRLMKRFAINIKPAVLKANQFTRQPHNPFHQQNVVARITDAHDVAALGFAAQISEPVKKFDAAVLKRRNHAGAGDANRSEDEPEKKHCDQTENDDRNKTNERAFWATPNGDGSGPIQNSHAFCFRGHYDGSEWFDSPSEAIRVMAQMQVNG